MELPSRYYGHMSVTDLFLENEVSAIKKGAFLDLPGIFM